MAGQGRRKRRASSDLDESDDEEDRLEKMLADHQQRNVSNWGQGEESSSSNNNSRATNRLARRDERRDMQRKKRRDENESDLDDSFAVDTVGTGVTISTEQSNGTSLPSSVSVQRVDGLLLPGHVDVQTEEEKADQEEKEQDLIDEKVDEAAQGELGDFVRLDGDRPGPAARYYEAEEEENRKAHEECLTCGEMGHDKKSCPHLQCLACGALDEHPTRQCPMGMSCFRCGGQGHKALDCKKPRTQGPQGWKECQRCGSTSHVDPKCPTLWRLYFYQTAPDYDQERRQKYKAVGATAAKGSNTRGGFEYRSESEEDEEEGEITSQEKPPTNWDPVVRWCYNCAAEDNHWGDDCPLPRCNPTRQSGDPSGFSEYMACSGPFAHSLPPPPVPDQYAYRSGLRRGRDEYDRFEAGPGASMHIYDPQREAMHSVDQLFDRYGPAASRRRDASKRGSGDLASRLAPPPPPPRVDRKSGQGSKAQRYQEMAQEKDRDRDRDRWSSADYHRRDGRSSQVSAVAYGPTYTSETPSDHTSAEESVDEDFELTHVNPALRKAKKDSMTNSSATDRALIKRKRKKESKMAAASALKERLAQPVNASKRKVRAAVAVEMETEKLSKAEKKALNVQETLMREQKGKRGKEQKAEERMAKEQAKKEAKRKAKMANRKQMKASFQEAQARRLANGKVEEHDRKAREFAVQEEKWLADN